MQSWREILSMIVLRNQRACGARAQHFDRYIAFLSFTSFICPFCIFLLLVLFANKNVNSYADGDRKVTLVIFLVYCFLVYCYIITFVKCNNVFVMCFLSRLFVSLPACAF